MATDNSRAIKELLEVIKHKVDGTEVRVRMLSHEIREVKDQQSVLNEKLDQIQETLESHGGSLVNIESRLEGFADAWKINRAEINKVKKHLGLPSIAE